MNEELLRIQKMVAAGKITPEEGAEQSASFGGPVAPPTSSAVDESAPPKKNRKTVGLIALGALVAGWLPSLLIELFRLLFPAGGTNRDDSAWTAIILLVLASLFPVLMTIAAILGFYAWRTLPGKIAAIGGIISGAYFVLPPPSLWHQVF